MRIGKRMRKVVSWLLAGALVVMGTSGIGTINAEANSTLKWTGELYMGVGWGWSGDASVGITPSVTNEDSTLELTAIDWNDVGVGVEVIDIADFADPWITVVATETEDGEPHEFAVTDADWNVTYAGVNGIDNPETEEFEDEIANDVTIISGALDRAVTNYNVVAQGRTVTAVYVHEKGMDPTVEEPEAPDVPDVTEEPEATEEPIATEIVRTTAESFDVKYTLFDPSWGMHESETVTITGNGTYAISGTATSEMEDIMMLWLDAGMLGYDNDYNIQIESSAIQVGDDVYAASDANWWYRNCDSLETAKDGTDINESDGMKTNCRRLTYRNQYVDYYDKEGNVIGEKSPVNAMGDEEIFVAEGDEVTIYITVSGMLIDNEESGEVIPSYTATPSTETPVSTALPTAPPKGFNVVASLFSPSWSVYNSEAVNITGNGTYAVDITVGEEMEDINLLWIDAGLLGYDNDGEIEMEALAMKVGNSQLYSDLDANWWYRDCESLEAAAEGTAISESDGMKRNCRRLTYRNPYNSYFDEDGEVVEESSPMDAFEGEEIAINEGDVVTLYIEVYGMEEDNEDVDITVPEYVRSTADSFDVSYWIYDPTWTGFRSETVNITGNGTYAISGITGSDMEDIMMLWLDAGLLGYDNDYNITMESSVIQVGNIVYAASDANWWYKDCDSLEEAQDGTDINESDDMKKNCRRLNYRNQYSNFYDEDGNKIKEKSPVDALSEQEIPATAADTITIYVTVSGMDVDNPEANVKIPDVGIYTSPSPEAPIPTAMPEKTSVAPSYTSIPGIITTPSAIPSAPIESASVPSVSQTPVVTINPPSDVPSPTPNMDLEEDDEDDEYDEDEEEDEDDEELEEGDTFQKSGFIYTLLNSKSVTVSGYAKNANGLTIASTVTYKSTKYKIVGIESEAFSYMTTLKKITIGANVKSIGKKAFANCKKLKTIEIKSKKIVKVGANVFKNISGSAKIYVPKKKYGAYKALFRKKGQKSSVKIVKGNW